MINTSIHPGVIGGKRIHPLERTSKPHKGGGKLAKKRAKLSLRRTAHSATLQDLSRSFKGNLAGAFKVPGSLNQHK